MFSFTGLHVWQSGGDPHQAAPIHGFQIDAETGMSVEDCAWAVQSSLLVPMVSCSGSAVRLLRASSCGGLPSASLQRCDWTAPQVWLRGLLSVHCGRDKEWECHRQSPEQVHPQPLSWQLEAEEGEPLIHFLSSFPSFPWETQDIYVSSH